MDLRRVASAIIERRRRGEIPVIIQASSDSEANLIPTYYSNSVELAIDIMEHTPPEAIISYDSSSITVLSYDGWLSYEFLGDSEHLEETLYLLA